MEVSLPLGTVKVLYIRKDDDKKKSWAPLAPLSQCWWDLGRVGESTKYSKGGVARKQVDSTLRLGCVGALGGDPLSPDPFEYKVLLPSGDSFTRECFSQNWFKCVHHVGRATSLYFGDSFHILYTQRVATEVRRAHLTTRKQFHVREMFCKGRAGGWTRCGERLLEGLADGQPNAWMDGRKAWKG